MSQRFLIARTGWMKRYAGSQPGDERAVSGARFLKTRQGPGDERFNFLAIAGKVYGYFRPTAHPGGSKIDLDRIQPGFTGEKLCGVTVVFIAPKPLGGGQRVIGWYSNATVFRLAQPTKLKARDKVHFLVQVSANDAVLVPWAERTEPVPSGKGAIGEANICYPYTKGKAKDRGWMKRVLDYVKNYAGENLVREPRDYFGPDVVDVISPPPDFSVGFEPNKKIRDAIEQYAVKHATRYFRKRKYKVTPRGKPYDLLCAKGNEELHVEVKGTRGKGDKIVVTFNEVRHARHYAPTALYVVHHVTVTNDVAHGVKVKGGVREYIRPWDIQDRQLKSIQYLYTLPQHF
jgi:Domain of unknown function (DUF3883)